jgi:hypothetical protein
VTPRYARAANILRTVFRDSDIIARIRRLMSLSCSPGLRRHASGDRPSHRAAIDAHNASAARRIHSRCRWASRSSIRSHPITLDAVMAESDTDLYEAKRRRAAARELMA